MDGALILGFGNSEKEHVTSMPRHLAKFKMFSPWGWGWDGGERGEAWLET